jgi:hypothetical protein
LWHYPGGNEESNENPVSIAGLRAEILNRDLPMKKKNLNLMLLLPIFLVPNHQPTPLPDTEMAVWGLRHRFHLHRGNKQQLLL